MKDITDEEASLGLKALDHKDYMISDKMKVRVSGNDIISYYFNSDIDIIIKNSNKLNPELDAFISKFNPLSKDSTITANNDGTICLHITGSSALFANTSPNIYDLLGTEDTIAWN